MSTTVVVSDLPPSATEARLLPYFSKFGSVVCIRLRYDRETGACLGHGFVAYRWAEEANAVLRDTKTRRKFSVGLPPQKIKL
jgi:RNA recognition motif-containing protein